MPRIVMSIIPDETDGPFACTIDVSGEVTNLNELAILTGNFVRTFSPAYEEVRIYPKGSGVYYSSNHLGVLKEEEPGIAQPVGEVMH